MPGADADERPRVRVPERPVDVVREHEVAPRRPSRSRRRGASSRPRRVGRARAATTAPGDDRDRRRQRDADARRAASLRLTDLRAAGPGASANAPRGSRSQASCAFAEVSLSAVDARADRPRNGPRRRRPRSPGRACRCRARACTWRTRASSPGTPRAARRRVLAGRRRRSASRTPPARPGTSRRRGRPRRLPGPGRIVGRAVLVDFRVGDVDAVLAHALRPLERGLLRILLVGRSASVASLLGRSSRPRRRGCDAVVRDDDPHPLATAATARRSTARAAASVAVRVFTALPSLAEFTTPRKPRARERAPEPKLRSR